MKRCSKCKADKPLDEFNNNRSKKDGKSTECRACTKEYSRTRCKTVPIEERINFIPADKLTPLKVCSRCNTEKPRSEFANNKTMRDGKNPYCKQCFREYQIERRMTIPRIKELEKLKRQTSKHKQQKRNAYLKLRQDPVVLDKLRKQSREWKRANRDRVNPTHRNTQRIRNHRSRHAPGKFTREEFDALCDSFGNVCLCCKQQTKLTVDHVVPLSKGGSNDISNLQPLCASCNSKKRARIIDYRQSFK